MKKLLALLFVFTTMGLMVSCDEDDPKVDGEITIAGTEETASIENLGTYEADVVIGATDGLKSYSVTKDGTAYGETKTFDGEVASTEAFTFTATADDEDKNVVFKFSVTDINDNTTAVTSVISVGAAVAVETVVVSGTIDADASWSKDKIYELAGRVIVTAGTLTIEEGTIIKGRTGTGSSASALVIARGAKIMAEGTADEPIIFTSVLDEITVGGEYVGNLKREDNEKWGGLIILGKANVSAKEGDTETAIEGLPADEVYGKYGAATEGDFVDNDNSGTLKYVSIRHGGAVIGAGNEINGLTLGGVGSGTTIDNIEIFATLDDGIEFFGGSVNVTNALVYWQGDDGLDIDQNYDGTIDNFLVYHGDKVGTDEGLEIDGPEGTLKDGVFTLKNGSLIGDGVAGSAADIKSDAQGKFENVVFSGYATGKGIMKFEAEYAEDDCSERSGALDIGTFNDALDHLLDGTTLFTNCTAEGVSVYSKTHEELVDGETVNVANCSSVPANDQTAAEGKFTTSASATGGSKTGFGWTAAVKSGNVTL